MIAAPLLFTMGDPLSVNVEALLRVIVAAAQRRPVVAIGSKWQLTHQAEKLGLHLPAYRELTDPLAAELPGLYVVDPLPLVGCESPTMLSLVDRGKLLTAALQAVPSSAKSKQRFAVLTAPIDKYAGRAAGFSFPGQTEFFEELWQGDAVMLLAGPKLRVALATNHVALRDVVAHVSSELIQKKLKILATGLQDLYGISKPRIAVCGLNPHCGDHGLFGDEETRVIAPAVAWGKMNLAADVVGPVPADTVFYRAFQGEYDAVFAMYHDQGLGPLKLVHFDEAVNVSLGLKYLRVSPDHGPAADLYGTARASMKSFAAALQLCEQWLDRPREAP